MSVEKTWRLTAENARVREVTGTYDAPEAPSGFVDLIQPKQPHPTAFREFLAFRPGTGFYNHTSPKGRARRS